jgi:hypothetical protein
MTVTQEKKLSTENPSKKFSKKPDKKIFFLIALCVLLGITVLTESILLYVQGKVNKQIEAQSQRALERFQRGDQSKQESGFGTYTKLSNVLFRWSQKVYVRIPLLTGKITPLNKSNLVNFDNLNSFIIKVYNAQVFIKPDVLQGMFNESVFNYPNSKLRNLTVSIVGKGQNQSLRLGGSLNYILWVPFEMLVRLSVDQQTNTLVITVNKLKVFGFIPATKLIDFQPFRLEKLLSVPANNHLYVRQNRIMVKPFGLFPPPKIDGKMERIEVFEDMLKLSFKNLSENKI